MAGTNNNILKNNPTNSTKNKGIVHIVNLKCDDNRKRKIMEGIWRQVKRGQERTQKLLYKIQKILGQEK